MRRHYGDAVGHSANPHSRNPASSRKRLRLEEGLHMPDTAENAGPNVRSTRYFIAESKIACLQCNAVTKVFAFALPAGYESLNVDDNMPDDESGTWEMPGMAAV